jgi:hypothetical protein
MARDFRCHTKKKERNVDNPIHRLCNAPKDREVECGTVASLIRSRFEPVSFMTTTITTTRMFFGESQYAGVTRIALAAGKRWGPGLTDTKKGVYVVQVLQLSSKQVDLFAVYQTITARD